MNLNTLFVNFLLFSLLSCSSSKENYNHEIADKMTLEVNYINNQMPTMDGTSSKYISFMIIPKNGSFEENWKAVSLTATTDESELEILKFDKNEFEAKGKTVYRNNARLGASDLGSNIDVIIFLENENGKRIKLSKSNIEEEIVQ